MATILENGGHIKILRGPRFFLRVTPLEYLCQICCLYHNLNDSSDICNYLLHYGEYGRINQSSPLNFKYIVFIAIFWAGPCVEL